MIRKRFSQKTDAFLSACESMNRRWSKRCLRNLLLLFVANGVFKTYCYFNLQIVVFDVDAFNSDSMSRRWSIRCLRNLLLLFVANGVSKTTATSFNSESMNRPHGVSKNYCYIYLQMVSPKTTATFKIYELPLVARCLQKLLLHLFANGESMNRCCPMASKSLRARPAASRSSCPICCMGASRCVGPPGDTFFVICFKSYLFCS